MFRRGFFPAVIAALILLSTGVGPGSEVFAQTEEQSSSQSDAPMKVDMSGTPGVDSAGTVRVNSLANMEALLNIVANGIEIWGIGSVGNFFAGAIICFVLKRPVFGAICVILCPVSLVFGLGTPGMINWLVASARDANLFEGPNATSFLIPIILLPVVVVLAIGFIPAVIAFRRNHQHRFAILGTTLVAWMVPFGWPALLFWSMWDRKIE